MFSRSLFTLFLLLAAVAGCAGLSLPSGKRLDLAEPDPPPPRRAAQKEKVNVKELPNSAQTDPAEIPARKRAAPAQVSAAPLNVNPVVVPPEPAAAPPITTTKTAPLPTTVATSIQPTTPAVASAAAVESAPGKVEPVVVSVPAAAVVTVKAPVVATAAEVSSQPTELPHGNKPQAVADKKDKTVGAAKGAENASDQTPQERLAEWLRGCQDQIAALEKEIQRRRLANEKDTELARLEQMLRLLYLAVDKPDAAASEIEELPAPEREAFRHLAFGLTSWLETDQSRRSGQRNAQIVRELHSAAADLSKSSKLDLRNITLCEKVESYGWFTEFAKKEFKPKQEVILYVEVENFTAEKKPEGGYETELLGSYQIFDAGGQMVSERKLPLDKEVCRNYRRDYFLAYRIYLPEGLPAGKYRLELTVEDLKAKSKEYQGRKFGESLIEFSTIGG